MPVRVALVRAVRSGHAKYLALALVRVPIMTLDRRMLREAARLCLEPTPP